MLNRSFIYEHIHADLVEVSCSIQTDYLSYYWIYYFNLYHFWESYYFPGYYFVLGRCMYF